MAAKALITSARTINIFLSEPITTNGLLLNLFLLGELLVWKTFLSGMPARVQRWYRALTKSRWITLLFGTLTFLCGTIVSGIVGGESLNFWSTSIKPWLSSNRPVSNAIVLLLILGCFLFFLAFLLLLGVYGANRRTTGQLDTIQKENDSRGQSLNQRTTEVAQLNTQVTQLTNNLTQRETQLSQLASDLERLRKETRLLDIIRNTDRELFVLFTQPTITADEIKHLIEVIFRRTFDLWGLDKVHRASIYTPDSDDPDILAIKWDYGVGEVSRHWNWWYIGKQDPATRGLHRGIPGSVYVKGESRFNEDVTSDPDQVDPYQPKRSVLPYHSTVQALIQPDDKQKKLGVLCFDSLDYVFIQHDLTLVEQVATRIGWLMQAELQQHQPKGKESDTN